MFNNPLLRHSPRLGIEDVKARNAEPILRQLFALETERSIHAPRYEQCIELELMLLGDDEDL